ncbi:MAG: O-antigen ligase family protein [Flavobacteriales bacterium]|nr:O-antigen ligase family protein [Flavobacteriales bacterium]
MISKIKLVNTLFLLSFPFYGLGTYVTFKTNFSAGVILSVLPSLLILSIYGLDVLYRGRVTPMVNRVYGVAMLFILSLVASMWVAFAKGFPGLNMLNTTSLSVMFIVPFNAAVVVQVYNRGNENFDFAWLVLKGLAFFILLNLIGYGAGLRNLVHGFEGRINLPFMRGIYDASHVMSVVNLMLLFYLRDLIAKPFRYITLGALFMVNMAIMMNINSRLSFMIFVVLLVLFLFKFMKVIRGLFTVSLFTMPLLMSFALLIYEVLSLPFFVAILQRVDKEDVTTFNGRTYIWNSMADWAMYDRTGWLFGLGYRGQYELRMLDFLAILWQEEHSYNFHLHSTFLEITMDQGLIGLVLFYACMWFGFSYYRKHYRAGTLEGPLFAGIVYLMFIWQIDIFCYGIDLGNPIFFTMLSLAAIHPCYITRGQRMLNGQLLA